MYDSITTLTKSLILSFISHFLEHYLGVLVYPHYVITTVLYLCTIGSVECWHFSLFCPVSVSAPGTKRCNWRVRKGPNLSSHKIGFWLKLILNVHNRRKIINGPLPFIQKQCETLLLLITLRNAKRYRSWQIQVIYYAICY